MNLFALEILNGELGSTSKAHWPLLRCDDLLHRAQSQQFDSTAEKLMYFVSQGVEGVRPTLLRQLAGWPHYVKSIAGFVTTICVDERFLIQVNGVREFAVERVRDMAPRETSSSLATKSAETMHAFCGYFPVPLIRMTIIAQYLRMSLSTELIIQ